jgi:hypothetical protein
LYGSRQLRTFPACEEKLPASLQRNTQTNRNAIPWGVFLVSCSPWVTSLERKGLPETRKRHLFRMPFRWPRKDWNLRPAGYWFQSYLGSGARIQTNDRQVTSSNPETALATRKRHPFGCLSGSGARIRTWDLRVMSPTSCLCSTPQRARIIPQGASIVKNRFSQLVLSQASRKRRIDGIPRMDYRSGGEKTSSHSSCQSGRGSGSGVGVGVGSRAE